MTPLKSTPPRDQTDAVAASGAVAAAGDSFCAGAAAGCAASLNATQMLWLLSYTAQQAGGIASWQRDTQHIEKGFDFAGMPARNRARPLGPYIGLTSAWVDRAPTPLSTCALTQTRMLAVSPSKPT